MAALLNWDERFLAFPPGTIAKIDVKDLTSSPQGTLMFLLSPFIE
jgi:hypothetical protein